MDVVQAPVALTTGCDSRVPLLITWLPRGDADVMSKRALSCGWSLTGNHHGAMCGSFIASASSGSAKNGRSPSQATLPGVPW